jgi:hypothetical protein
MVKETLYTCIGLGGVEAENVFLHLILKEMIFIRKNESGQEYVIVRNPEIVQMYLGYLRAKQCNNSMPGETFKDNVFEFIEFLRAAGTHNGRKEGDRLIRVGLPQVEIEMERSGKQRFADQNALDELVAAKMVIRQEDVTESTFGTHKRATLVYNDEVLRRISLLRAWLPIFKEDIHF